LARRRKFIDSLGSVDELKERRRCLPDYAKAPSDKEVWDSLSVHNVLD
jgi:hypothetical protein